MQHSGSQHVAKPCLQAAGDTSGAMEGSALLMRLSMQRATSCTQLIGFLRDPETYRTIPPPLHSDKSGLGASGNYYASPAATSATAAAMAAYQQQATYGMSAYQQQAALSSGSNYPGMGLGGGGPAAGGLAAVAGTFGGNGYAPMPVGTTPSVQAPLGAPPPYRYQSLPQPAVAAGGTESQALLPVRPLL